MSILIDLDDVLADFTTQALAAHGTTTEKLLSQTPHLSSEWSLARRLGLSLEQFWEPIDSRGFSFWYNLPLLPWAKHLIETVWVLDPKFLIVSSPHGYESPASPDRLACYNGKLEWVNKHFGSHFVCDHLILTSQKHRFANPHTFLIDDCPTNIHKFVAAEGQGILFPTPFNSTFPTAKQPLASVYPQLFQHYYMGTLASSSH